MSDDDDFLEDQEFVEQKREKKRNFIPFNKLVDQIGADSDKFSRKYRLNRDDNGTYFTETLMKWNDADHGADFVSFSDGLPSRELETYAQLLFHSKTIITSLFEHMKIEKTQSSQSFCELLTALSKDLREDFTEYLWEAIDAIVHVLDDGLQNKETIEAGFYALTSIVKVMSKPLVKSIKKTFNRFIPLLGSSRGYVRRFVAQAIAFLLRKVNMLSDLTQYMIEQAEKINEKRLSEGIAMLLFQTYRGISGGFQSSSTELLRSIVFGVFKTENPIRETGLAILENTLRFTTLYVKDKKSDLNPVQNIFSTLLESNKNTTETSDLLRLFAVLIIKHERLTSLSDLGKLYHLIQTLVEADHFTLDDNSINFLHLALTVALDETKWITSSKDIFHVILRRFQETHISDVFRFLHLIYKISVFDLNILPSLTVLVEPAVRDGKKEVLRSVIDLLARVCADRRPLAAYEPGVRKPFFDVDKHKVLSQYVTSILAGLKNFSIEEASLTVQVWPWLFAEGQKAKGVDHVVKYLDHLLSLDEFSAEVSQAALIVCYSLYIVQSDALRKISRDKVEAFLKKQSSLQSSTVLYLLFIKAYNKTHTSKDIERIINLFIPQIYCSNSKQRLAILEILSFCELNYVDGSDIKNFEGAFTFLKNAESVGPIHYRERLRFFRLLVFGAHEKYVIPELATLYEEIILRVAYAQFFVNFTVLWPGMHEILSSFAVGMNMEKFFAITENIFLQVTEGCKKSAQHPIQSVSTFDHILKDTKDTYREDYPTVRIQLLKFFTKVPHLFQRRTRFLSPLFIDIFENEYLAINEAHIEDTDENEHDEESPSEDTSTTFVEVGKALCAYMGLFAKFEDGKSVYRQADVRKIYDEILITGSEVMLPFALQCVYSYKDKSVNTYREHLDGLISPKGFSNKLVILKISEDEDDAVVSSQHREKFIPVLLRVLLGILTRKGEKKFLASRRAAIFRYLMGCRQNEIQFFLELCFRSVHEVVGNDDNMSERMKSLCNDESVLEKIQLGRLSGSLKNASDLVQQASQVLTQSQKTFLYRLFLCIGRVIAGVTDSTTLPEYKKQQAASLRKRLSVCMTYFFRSSYARQYGKDEIQELFDVFISPCVYMDNVHLADAEDEPLLTLRLANVRILAALSGFPSLFHFYTYNIENKCNVKVSAFDLMISILFRRDVPALFFGMVRKSVLNLLTFADEKGMIMTETENVKRIEGVNYGSSIALGSLDRLLTFLARTLQRNIEKKVIEPENLDILNKLSDYVQGGEVAEKLVFILLSYLKRKIPREDICLKLLQTIRHLAKGIVDYKKFMNEIGPLYIKIHGHTLRAALADICGSLMENPNVPDDFKKLMPICSDLDSYEANVLDEPDHDKRHDAFAKIYKLTDKNEHIDPIMLKFITQLCYHTLIHTTELSLRSTSGTTIRAIFEYLKRVNYEEIVKTELVSDTMISLTLLSLNKELEVVRDESIRFIRTLVTCFPTHPQLEELTQLLSTDPDKDFFMNLYHIQKHKRQNAIRDLSTKLREEQSITLSFTVLNSFIAPMIVPHLVKVNEKDEMNTDVALKLYKSIYSLSPWKNYWGVFRLWLNRTERSEDERKSVVRVLCAIIDAFHFDVADAEDVLNEDESNREAIYLRSLMNSEIIPRLQICINGNAPHGSVHKKARTGESIINSEKDDNARVPVALATVKLLLKLPKSYLDQYLHGIILRLCKLAIARSVFVRKNARETTVKAVNCLGPQYLSPVIKEMKMIMDKGYQIHVMIFTIHTLIHTMRSKLTTGILDSCLNEIMDSIIQDQFGDVSDEKEIGAIRAKIYEAKGNTAPETIMFVGKYSSPSVLGIVIEKLQHILEMKCTRKAVSRAGNLLSKFAVGIKLNPGVSIETQLILVHNILDTNIARMEKVQEGQTVTTVTSFRPQSCFLLPEAPRRVGAVTKTSVKSRVHIFVEFALQLLAALFKEKRLRGYGKPKLEPFVPLVLRCLSLKYDSVITHGLDCLYHFLKHDLSSVNSNIKSIIDRLFVLLADYINLGDAANQPEVLQLNNLLFKAFTKIIFNGHESHFTSDHVELLLNYIETDIMDTNKQATAFTLIKAMISRKMDHPRIPVVLRRISELTVIADQLFIRRHCRETVCKYVFEHPICNKNEYFEFFADQLDYEFSEGRKSAAEVLFAFFNELLPPSLEDSFMYCLTKLGMRLVNETVPDVRKYIALTLRKLLAAISDPMKIDVIEVATEWLNQHKEAARAIGFTIFVELSHVEKTHFIAHLDTVMKSVTKVLSSEDVMDMNSERSFTNMMEGLVHIINNIGEEQAKEFVASKEFYRLCGYLEPLVKCFGSTDTRKSACELIGLALSLWDTPLKMPKAEGVPSLVQLCEWMCWLIKDNLPNEDVSEQASKNIVFMVSWLPLDDFKMIIDILYNTCQFEIINKPMQSVKRLTCFKIAAALIMKDGKCEQTDIVINKFFDQFEREISMRGRSSSKVLQSLASEIALVLQNVLGEHEYNMRFAEAQKQAVLRAQERKQKLKELAVTAPHEYAEYRRQQNQRLVVRRKRKLDILKPHRVTKRKHAQEQMLRRDD